MALRELQDFVIGGPAGQSLPVNLYLEPDNQYGYPILTSTPGLVSAGTMGSATIRNILSFNDVLYGVSGTGLYSWTGSGAGTLQGSGIGITTNPYWVSMDINYDPSGNYEIAIVDGQNTVIWYYNVGTDTFGSVNAPSGITPTNVTYLKQVFVIGENGGNRVYCSAADDVTTAWDPLYFSSKTARPDRVRGVMAVNQDLWVFGETSTEIWYYTGAASGLPFALMGGGVLDVGCISIASVATMDNSVYWLNNRAEVCRSTGYSYEVISSPLVNEALQSLAASNPAYLTNAKGFAILWEGHPWYVLNLPTGNRTYVFDLLGKATGFRGWHIWSSNSLTARHYSTCSALYKGDWIVGSYNGNLYSLSNSTYTDNSLNNYRKAYGNTIYGAGELVRLNQLIAQGSFPATGTGYYLRLGGTTNIDASSLTSPVRWSGVGSGTSITPTLTYYGSGKCELHKVFADISAGRRR